MITTNDLKNGYVLDIDGELVSVVSFQHVKPGKGGAFVRTKLKNMHERRRRGEDVPRGREGRAGHHREPHDAVPLPRRRRAPPDGQLHLRADRVASSLVENDDLLAPNTDVQVLFVRDSPIRVELPTFVELAVTRTDPGVKGDTVSNVTKPAEVETGATIDVPLFVNEGDRLKIDTRTREYSARA